MGAGGGQGKMDKKCLQFIGGRKSHTVAAGIGGSAAKCAAELTAPQRTAFERLKTNPWGTMKEIEKRKNENAGAAGKYLFRKKSRLHNIEMNPL